MWKTANIKHWRLSNASNHKIIMVEHLKYKQIHWNTLQIEPWKPIDPITNIHIPIIIKILQPNVSIQTALQQNKANGYALIPISYDVGLQILTNKNRINPVTKNKHAKISLHRHQFHDQPNDLKRWIQSIRTHLFIHLSEQT